MSSGIFDLDSQAHQIGLKVSRLVDRTLALGFAFIDDKHRLLWPRAALAKVVVGPALHEDVGEQVVAGWSGTVVHAVASREKLPIAVIRRAEQKALRVIRRLGGSVRRRSGQQRHAES